MKSNRSRREHPLARYAVLTALLVGVLVTLSWLWSGAPQIQHDEQVFRSLDALFTAMTAQSDAKLRDCASRLEALHDEGRIPEAAWQRITQYKNLASQGEWETAAKRLYAFISAQRGNP